VSKKLPLPWLTKADTTLKPTDNGLHARIEEEVHCFAAEAHATFLRVAIRDGDRDVAFETAVLGRLRGGFRVLRLRSSLGTRIELACLFVHVSFGTVPNLWPTPRCLRRQAGRASRERSSRSEEFAHHMDEIAKLRDRLEQSEEQRDSLLRDSALRDSVRDSVVQRESVQVFEAIRER